MENAPPAKPTDNMSFPDRIRYELFVKDPRRKRFLQLMLVLGSTILEMADLVSDIIVFIEFYNNDWMTEFIASLIIFGLHTMFIIFIGIFVESSENRQRYVANNPQQNRMVSIAISAFQLRPIVETYFIYQAFNDPMANSRFDREDSRPMTPEHDPPILVVTEGNNTNTTNAAAAPLQNESSFNSSKAGSVATAKSNIPVRPEVNNEGSNNYISIDYLDDFERLVRSRAAVLLMSGMFEHAPQLILQTYAIFKRQMSSPKIIISSTISFGSLVGALATYSCKEDSIFVQLMSLFYVSGQLGLRITAIIAVATARGPMANGFYVACIIAFAVAWGTFLGLGRKVACFTERLIVSVIISPMLTLFAVDTSGQDLHTGSAYTSWTNASLLPFTLWRLLENFAGVAIAATAPDKIIDEFYTLEHLYMVSGSFAALYVLGYIVLGRVAALS